MVRIELMLWEQARRRAGRGHDVRVVSRADPDATAPVSIERDGVRIRQFIADRRSIAQDDFGLGYCNITKCCTEVCPEHIKITDNALIPMKERVAGRKYDPLVWLGSKIGRRSAKDTPKVPDKA